MITVVKTPPEVALCCNPMLYEVSSDNFIVTAGTNALLNLIVAGADSTAGHGFTLTFKDKVLVFVSAATPDDSGLQFPVAAGGDTFSTYAAKIYAALILNWDLISDYDITLETAGGSSRTINMTAKQKDAALSITASDITLTSLTDSNTPGVTTVYRENFGIICTIWDSSGEKIGEDIKSVDDTGTALFDIHDYLESELEDGLIPGESRIDEPFTWPEETGTPVVSHDLNIQKYIISFQETWENEVKKLNYDSERYAVNGGINRELVVYYNENDTSYFDESANKLKFLSWTPLIKLTGSTTPEKLYFLIYDRTFDFKYTPKCKIYYTDGSSSTFDIVSEQTVTTLKEIELMVGYAELGLAAKDATKLVFYWEVWMVDHDNAVITEKRKFYLDYKYREWEHKFLFRNSFAVYEMARFTGKREKQLEYTFQDGVLISEEAWTSLNAPKRNFQIIETQKFIINTGWISQEMKNYYRELFLSKEAWEIIGGQLIPVIIRTTKTNTFFKDGETLYNLVIEYDRAFDNSYSGTDFEQYSAYVPPIVSGGGGGIPGDIHFEFLNGTLVADVPKTFAFDEEFADTDYTFVINAWSGGINPEFPLLISKTKTGITLQALVDCIVYIYAGEKL
jgi:hypothetical protein